ncbi:MAG: transposase, partial [Synergistes sp.]|nr:transposase [Synergistes sp.]
MGEKDAAEKKLLAFNDVFAGLCNAIIFKGKRYIKPEDLTDAASASSYKFAGKIHSQECDVVKLWKNKEIRIALFGVENQTNYDPDMTLRVFCYEGAGYRWQLTENKNIGRNDFRYPVVTFVLNFSTKEKWKKKRLLDRVKVPKSLLPFVNDYKINVIDLAWLDEETTKLFHGEMRFLIEYLSAVRQNKKLKLSDEVITHYNELIGLFSLLSGITNESLSAIFT